MTSETRLLAAVARSWLGSNQPTIGRRASGAFLPRRHRGKKTGAAAMRRAMGIAASLARASSVSRGSLELVGIVGEQHVETGERPITPAHVGLQLHLDVVGQVGGVDLLFERTEPVPQHDD